MGRSRLKASLRVTFNKPAPIIVIAKSFASRPHFRMADQATKMIVPTVSDIVDPINDNARIIVVSAGEAS